MPRITLRTTAGTSSEDDLVAEVRDVTFQYLLSSPAPTIRVSSFLDRDWANVQKTYVELFVSDGCAYVSTIRQITPGSRTRKGIVLPGPMEEGEQLTIEVARGPAPPRE